MWMPSCFRLLIFKVEMQVQRGYFSQSPEARPGQAWRGKQVGEGWRIQDGLGAWGLVGHTLREGATGTRWNMSNPLPECPFCNGSLNVAPNWKPQGCLELVFLCPHGVTMSFHQSPPFHYLSCCWRPGTSVTVAFRFCLLCLKSVFHTDTRVLWQIFCHCLAPTGNSPIFSVWHSTCSLPSTQLAFSLLWPYIPFHTNHVPAICHMT